MSEDELRQVAPSIFATEAHASRSERFAPIATIEVLRNLEKEGFVTVGARQCTTRDDSKKAYTKHLIRLRRIDDRPEYRVGDTICEILLKNANDGSSVYDLMAGLFRVVCCNSLVAQTGTIDTVKVRHSGDAIGKVIEGTYRVLGEAQQALAAPQDWPRIALQPESEPRLRKRRTCSGLATPTAMSTRLLSRAHCLCRAALRTLAPIFQSNL